MDLTRRPRGISAEHLNDPFILLDEAWLLEPSMRLAERSAALDRLATLIAAGLPTAPEGRDFIAELRAERAIDLARLDQRAAASELAESVLAEPHRSPLAVARAWEARGRVEAWAGTDAATARADAILIDVAGRYAALGIPEWQGYIEFWRGNAVYLQNGNLDAAERLFRSALDLLGPTSPRRATVLSFLGDLLLATGAWSDTEVVLDEAAAAAECDGDAKTRAYVTWSRARMLSVRGDASGTERHLVEVEREAGDWFAMHTGVTFLADAAELLDRVGRHERAADYLTRAQERSEDNEFVRQARAALLARTGDPLEAMNALHALVEGDWLEKRLRWRNTLLLAWAAYRAGQAEAGSLAARALEEAQRAGGVRVATATESELVRALLPLAEAAGSPIARALVADGRDIVIRVLGRTAVIRADGSAVALPPGRPAELVRMLAVHEHGLPVEVVCSAFFPEVDLGTGRHRLRQVTSRLRTAAGDLVRRDGDQLLLAPAWVDAREFLLAADRVRAAGAAQRVERAYAALGLWGGTPLPLDLYASWAIEARTLLDSRYLTLLDIVAVDAERRGFHEQAVTAITAALGRDPHDSQQYERLAGHLLALGRHATAHYLARISGIELDPQA